MNFSITHVLGHHSEHFGKTNLILDWESAEYFGLPMVAALMPSSQVAASVVASRFPNQLD